MKILHLKTLITILLFTAHICGFSLQVNHQIKQEKDRIEAAEKGLNFFVIGDWGKGDENQKKVAKAMATTARKSPIDFIVSVGDNFYPHGVLTINDKHWTNTFENVYTDSSLQKDWYTAIGNHDYMGRVKAQLKYHKKNPRWKTKKRYYHFSKPIPNSTDSVLFVFIDTNPFDRTMSKIQGGHWRQNKKTQLAWLKTTLGTSKAKWKIVVGHHPLFTTGFRRGKTADIQKPFLPIFEEYKVDVYFAGHDHDLQHQKPEGYTHYFISGAGSEYRGVTEDSTMTKFAAKSLGFMQINLTSNTMQVNVISGDSKTLYSTKVEK